jgi:ABC-type amino acid transport substrate-binding protein
MEKIFSSSFILKFRDKQILMVFMMRTTMDKQSRYRIRVLMALFFLWVLVLQSLLFAADLAEIKKNGELRHLGIPYAHFVSALPDPGLDVELVKLFAAYLGVKYVFVESNWSDIIADLTGKEVQPRGDDIQIVGESPVRGDVIATGFTILPWREKIVDFSTPTFPSGIWLVARADSMLKPINGSDSMENDIAQVKSQLRNVSVLTLEDSCLAPELYGLDRTGSEIHRFDGTRNLDEMIPAIMSGVAESTLIDAPVAMVALENWPGSIKVIGPVSPLQKMAYAFSKESPELREAFNTFFAQAQKDGTYRRLVEKYYPTVFIYYGDFFRQ